MKHHNMRARYEAAETLLTKHTRTAVLNGNPKIHWNADRSVPAAKLPLFWQK